MKLAWIYAFLFWQSTLAEQMIFQGDGGQIGDHLTSLYNAYVYAKKYNLKLVMAPFNNGELFECSNRVDQLPSGIYAPEHQIILVRTERDVINNLHKPNTHFYVNVLSERIIPDAATAQEAKQLLMPNKNLTIHTALCNPKEVTIAVHLRKGNGGGQVYDGDLASKQIFDYDRTKVTYIFDGGHDPFTYFRVEKALNAYNCSKHKKTNCLDQSWSTKFPPEQYYIDQIINLIRAKKDTQFLIKLITDEKNPEALLARLKEKIKKYSNATLELHTSKQSDIKMRIIEDLCTLSQAHILIRGQSGFSVIAEVIGNHKTVIFPIHATWIHDKLIMTTIVIRGKMP